MANFNLQDGYRDVQTGEAISFHNSIEPWSVKITVKNPGSTFTIPSQLMAVIDAVDYGTLDGFVQGNSIPSSAICGEIVILYFRPLDLPSVDQPTGEAWSAFLSQVLTLHDAFPPGVGYWFRDQGYITVDSPDFTAPDGIFNYIDNVQNPDFTGSTFKVGPRVYGKEAMRAALQWPPVAPTFASDRWEPFAECPNIESIDNQGELGKNCEAIYATGFVYTDADGYERVDAYPSGGRPRYIRGAIGPLKSFQMDSGSAFPVWDLTDLEICHQPVVAEEVVLPTRSSQISLPIGPNPKQSTKLRYYANGIEKIGRGKDTFGQPMEVPLFFGLKLLGIDLPDNLEVSINAHGLYRHQKRYGDIYFGAQADINAVKTLFNFNLGVALEQIYGNPDEELLMPHAGSELRYLSGYASVSVDQDYTNMGKSRPYYWGKLLPNGGLTGIQIPKLNAPKLKILDGYMERTYSYGRTGELTFTVPAGPTYTGEIRHSVPAPPVHDGIVIRNHRRYMASYVSGNSFTYSTSTGPNSAHLVYGQVKYGYPNPVVVLNLDENWLSSSHPDAVYFKELIDEDSWNALNDVVSGDIPRVANYELSISVDGFDIEPFDTSGISYAFSWEEGVFYGAQIDPTSIPNILTPIDLNKVQNGIDGAYRYALQVATPLQESIRYIDQRDTSEPSQTDPLLGTFTPNYTLILGYGVPSGVGDLYTYALEDIDIPDFILNDAASSVYDTWSNLFSYLIYGDLDGFKAAHGIDPGKNIGGSPGQPSVATAEYIGMGVLNWMLRDTGVTGSRQVIVPISLDPNGLGQRGFGVNLFREEIPYYPDQAPLYGAPIFISFSRVGKNYVWSDGNVYSFRQAVGPETAPI